MRHKATVTPSRFDAVRASRFTRNDFNSIDGCWSSESGRGREALLEKLESLAQQSQIRGILDHAWEPWDISLFMNRWCNVRISTATEELGSSRRFTRVRCTGTLTTAARVVIGAALTWSTVALICRSQWALLLGALAVAAIGFRVCAATRKAGKSAAALVDHAAAAAGLRRFAVVPRKKRHALRQSASKRNDQHDAEILDRMDELGADVA
jgi:hypothetical protein